MAIPRQALVLIVCSVAATGLLAGIVAACPPHP